MDGALFQRARKAIPVMVNKFKKYPATGV